MAREMFGGRVQDAGGTRPRGRVDFARLVQDALAHLHDPVSLLTHPLIPLIGLRQEGRGTTAGKLLQQHLLAAIESLRPDSTAVDDHAQRSFQILELRYVQARAIAEIIECLAVSRSEFYRDHRRAVDAVISALRTRWDSDDRDEPSGPQPSGTRRDHPFALPLHADRTAARLPIPLTRFLGREMEIADVTRLLGTSRLVTLIGAGGVGKTRLALHVASDLRGAFEDGIAFVDLAPLTDEALVPWAVASALDLADRPDRRLVDSVADYLRSKRFLLVVDNCEHVIDGGARLVDTLLHAVPRLAVLATSRQPLGIDGERTWRVPSLSVPIAGQAVTIDEVATYAAMRLFVDRAVTAQPSFAPTRDNIGAIARTCQRLDGIPLAIELAAAWARILSVDQVAARLDDRFALLIDGSRTAPARQRTLRAAIDWSYDLLADADRALLRRLSVFAGGWTLEAAEAVCVGEELAADDVLHALARLVDRSLVQMETHAGEVRYRLLETIRAYGAERLPEAGELVETRGKHQRCYLALAERSGGGLIGPDQLVWLDRLEWEQDNLRAALDWSLDPEARVGASLVTGLRLAGALALAWDMRSPPSEDRDRLTALLAAEGPAVQFRAYPAARARALLTAGELAFYHGDYAAMGAWLRESVALAKRAGDDACAARAILFLAYFDAAEGDIGRARVHAEEALSLSRRRGDQDWTATAIYALANLDRRQGRYGRAQARYEESLARYRAEGNQWAAALPMWRLGELARVQGDAATARLLYEESLAIFGQFGDRMRMARPLGGLAELALEAGDLTIAEDLLERRLALQRAMDDKPEIGDALRLLARLAIERGDLGRAMTLLRDSVALLAVVGALHYTVRWLDDAGMLAEAMEQPARALRLWAASRTLREASGQPRKPVDHARIARGVAHAREALEPEMAASACIAGRALTLEQAIAEALDICAEDDHVVSS